MVVKPKKPHSTLQSDSDMSSSLEVLLDPDEPQYLLSSV